MKDKLRHIKLLAMDVDGVLTAGDIVYSDSGEELKVFDIHDGLAMSIAVQSGLFTAIVSGRASATVERRASELDVTEVCLGCRNKAAAIRGLRDRLGLTPEQVAFVGDDLNDIPAFRESGLRIAVQNASAEVKAQADYVTKQQGGHGAIREVVELILEARGKWDEAVRVYLAHLEQA